MSLAAEKRHDIERITLDDLPEVMRMFKLTYGAHDEIGAWTWFRERMKDENHLFIGGPGCCLVGSVQVTFYWPSFPQLYSLFLFGDQDKLADPFLPLRLLRHLLSWGRSKGAKKFHLSSELGQADLTPFAKRLGMKHSPPGFVMEL